jgi:Virulence protein RhuM family
VDSVRGVEMEHGQIILYQSEDGRANLDVQLADETVWLTQAQMGILFERDQSVISRHLNNVFKEGELPRESNMQKMHTANSDKPVAFYNLNVIISVGYRVKSQRGTQFRIWATSVLRDHLVWGYSFNQQRLAEKGTDELRQVLALLSSTLESHNLVMDEGRAILDLINRYARTWQLLLQYDEDNLQVPAGKHETRKSLDLDDTRKAILSLKKELLAKGEATDLFGSERGHGLAGIIGAVHQTFGGQELCCIPVPKRKRPISSILSSRIIPLLTATNGSAPFSSCCSCKPMVCRMPERASTTGRWSPWPF